MHKAARKMRGVRKIVKLLQSARRGFKVKETGFQSEP